MFIILFTLLFKFFSTSAYAWVTESSHHQILDLVDNVFIRWFFCEGRKPGGDDIKCSERQWIFRSIVNSVSRSERSDWQESSISEVSACLDQSKSFWRLLFYVGMIYSVVLYLYKHIYILCSVFVCLSLYCMFVRCILYFIYFPKQ